MLPLALTIGLGNAWELKDLDRAVVRATHMARLRAASIDQQVEPDRFSNPAMLALSASFAALIGFRRHRFSGKLMAPDLHRSIPTWSAADASPADPGCLLR